VSLPWRDEVAVHLGPRSVAVARRGRVATAEVPAGAAPGDVGPAVECLARLAAAEGARAGAARVVVADHWARYAVVPWSGARLDAAGRLRLARYLLADTYGEEVAGWAVALDDGPPGRPILACALPQALRGTLEEALSPARLRLASLRPQLVAAFNAWRRRLPADDAWFATVDEGSLAAVHLSRGGWDRVHVARTSPDWVVELERLQALGQVTQGSGRPGRVFVEAPAALRRGAPAGAGLEWLEEEAALDEGTRARAMLRRARA
jgi:hypothetical protein